MYCLCKLAYANSSPNVSFPDGVGHCQVWRKEHLLSNVFVYFVPFLIGGVNYASKLTMKYISSFDK
jgi:hypothetical protein